MNEEKQKTDALEDALLLVNKALGSLRMAYPINSDAEFGEESDFAGEMLIDELLRTRRTIIKCLDKQSGKGK